MPIATMKKTRTHKPAICNSRVIRQPICPCEILPKGYPGSMLINGVSYAVTIIGRLPAEGEPIVEGYRFLREGSSEPWDVHREFNHLTCDCPDFVFRRVNVDRNGCKHCRAVRRHFQLPVELNF